MFIIYKTTNILNGKYYIGLHDTEKNNQNGFYYGSGRALKSAIKKYGKENFVRETLFEFDCLEKALEKEKELVTEEFVKDSKNYNLTVGGSLPPNTLTWWSDKHSKATSQRMIGNSYRLGIKDTEETKKKKRESMQKSTTIGRWERSQEHRDQIAKRAKEQMLNNNPMSNPKLREKVSLSKLGRKKVIKDNNFKYVLPNDIQTYLNQGYVLARP